MNKNEWLIEFKNDISKCNKPSSEQEFHFIINFAIRSLKSFCIQKIYKEFEIVEEVNIPISKIYLKERNLFSPKREDGGQGFIFEYNEEFYDILPFKNNQGYLIKVLIRRYKYNDNN